MWSHEVEANMYNSASGVGMRLSNETERESAAGRPAGANGELCANNSDRRRRKSKRHEVE